MKKILKWYLESMIFNFKNGKIIGIIFYLCRTIILSVLLFLIFAWIKVNQSMTPFWYWLLVSYFAVGILLFSFTEKYVQALTKEKNPIIFTYSNWSKIGFIYFFIWPWAVVGIYRNDN